MAAKDSISERQRQRVGDRKMDPQRQSSGVFHRSIYLSFIHLSPKDVVCVE
jgi:hypothetical protein